MSRVQFTNAVICSHVVWSDLNDLIGLFIILNKGRRHIGTGVTAKCHPVVGHVVHAIVLVVLLHPTQHMFLVDVQCHQIENRDDICWVVLQLLVKLLIVIVNVIAVDVQSVLLGLRDLLQFGDVVRFLHVPLVALIGAEIHLVIGHLWYESRQEFPQSV